LGGEATGEARVRGGPHPKGRKELEEPERLAGRRNGPSRARRPDPLGRDRPPASAAAPWRCSPLFREIIERRGVRRAGAARLRRTSDRYPQGRDAGTAPGRAVRA